MMTNIPIETLITFVFYLVAMLSVGWFGYRSTANLSDYILGGRRLGSFVTALSAGASDMSGWLLMGLPGAIYLSGLSQGWIAVGLIIGAWCNWKFVAQRLRSYTEGYGDSLTLPDYFSNRFNDNLGILKIFTSIVILIFFTIYCASGVVAGAKLFQSMFGIEYSTALWIGALATIAYVFIGGFLAVSWTDTIQASLMITALIIAPLMVIYSNNGIDTSINLIQQTSPHHNDIWAGLNFVSLISLLAWGLGYFGQPHILVRFMAASTPETINNARRISMTWMILCLAGAIAVGYFGFAHFSTDPVLGPEIKNNSERIFIELAKNLFNPWISGIFLAAILAAVMSTLSCQLLVSSSALTRDIYHSFLNKNASDKELVWIGRAMVLVISVIAIAIAQDPKSKILTMVSYAWAGFGASFGPAVIFSLFWTKMTKYGALAGMVTGAVVVIVWKQFEWLGLYEIIPGFILASIAIVIVSLLDNHPTTAEIDNFTRIRGVKK